MLNVLLTTRCNFKCPHCLWSCTRKGMDITPAVVHAIKDISGYGVNFLGGELTLVPGYTDIIRQILHRHEDCRIVTNGSWINSPRKTKEFRECVEMIHSLQPSDFRILISDDDYHREFWRHPDHIARCKWALESADYEGHLFEKDHRTWNKIISLGRAIENQLCCGSDEHYAYCSDYTRYSEPPEETNPWGEDVQVWPNGDISPCCQGQVVIGNIVTDGKWKIEKRLLAFYRDITPHLKFGDCKNCAIVNAKAIAAAKLWK